MKRALVLAIACTGCSSLLGIEELNGPGSGDDDVPSDTPPPPGTIRISGVVVQAGLSNGMPLPNLGVELVSGGGPGSDPFTSTDADGRFVIDVSTGGAPVDGLLRVLDPMGQRRQTYAYLAAPLTADLEVTLQVLDQASLDQLAQVCGANANPQFPFIAVETIDAGHLPVAGVKVSTAPLGTECVDTGSTPQQGDVTQAPGRIFVFNVPPGITEVTAGSATRSAETPPSATVFIPVITKAMP